MSDPIITLPEGVSPDAEFANVDRDIPRMNPAVYGCPECGRRNVGRAPVTGSLTCGFCAAPWNAKRPKMVVLFPFDAVLVWRVKQSEVLGLWVDRRITVIAWHRADECYSPDGMHDTIIGPQYHDEEWCHPDAEPDCWHVHWKEANDE